MQIYKKISALSTLRPDFKKKPHFHPPFPPLSSPSASISPSFASSQPLPSAQSVGVPPRPPPPFPPLSPLGALSLPGCRFEFCGRQNADTSRLGSGVSGAGKACGRGAPFRRLSRLILQQGGSYEGSARVLAETSLSAARSVLAPLSTTSPAHRFQILAPRA